MRSLAIKISQARQLRRDQTQAEYVLWSSIRNRQLDGIKFRRQQPVGSYIVDFISFEAKLILEVDGGEHNKKENKRKDLIRTRFLEEKGYNVLRFWNNEVLNNLEGVLSLVLENTSSLPSPGRRRR